MKIYKVGKPANDQMWDLGKAFAHAFEEAIFDVLNIALKSYFDKGLRIELTQASGDNGKDIVITTPVPVEIFGQLYHMRGKNRIQIYIECKSTSQNELRFDKIGSNVARVKEDNIDYFILVTNSKITPFSHYRIYEDLRLYDIEFVLADQYIVASYMKRFEHLPSVYDFTQPPEPIYVEYQIDFSKTDGLSAYNIYIVCRNYTNSNHTGVLSLTTDINWDIDENNYRFILEPYCSFTRKVSVVRAQSDGLKDLLLKIKVGENLSEIIIDGKDSDFIFEPPFIGKQNIACKQKFITWIRETDTMQIHYLWGDSGIGKSRIIKEIRQEINGTRFDFQTFLMEMDNQKTMDAILKFLIRKRYLNDSTAHSKFTDVVYNMSHPYRRAVIVIDDFHNAKKSLIRQMIEITKYVLDVPLTLIITGRTDYSVYNPEYFSFVQWCNEKQEISGEILTALTSEETKRLIQIMINQVPKVVMDKICAMSNNVPLFIVQFIEYLLEAKLVEVVNRNTVGITNISSFSSKLYIPDQIEKIYHKRLDYVNKLPEREHLLHILFVLTELNGHLTAETYLQLFNEKKIYVDILIEKRLIKIDGEGDYIFCHETLYLYFKNILNHDVKMKTKVATSLLLDHFNRSFLLSDLHKGKLYYWLKQTKYAKKHFDNIVNIIENISNFSNVNIDVSVYDYLYIIYSLYQRTKGKTKLLKNIITTRIYISLHHFSPTSAIKECDEALIRIEKNAALAKDSSLTYTVLTQKAHALLNAGQYIDGERILNHLLSSVLVQPNMFDLRTKFDLYDRLCSIHTKNNNVRTAKNFNVLSFQTAKSKHDISLEIIAHRTRSKLYFYLDPAEAWKSLLEVDKLTENREFERIRVNNKISMLIHSIVFDSTCDYEKAHYEAGLLLEVSLQNSYNFVVTRCYIAMAVSSYLHENQKGLYKKTKNLISNGIDASFRIGAASNIWQFYNLWSIIDSNLDYSSDHVQRLFTTVYSILAKQDLLFLGDKQMCYGSIQAISNIGFFLRNYGSESEFYTRMSTVSFQGNPEICDYQCGKASCSNICPNNKKQLQIEFQRAKKKQLLFVEQEPVHLLRDQKTQYFIVLS